MNIEGLNSKELDGQADLWTMSPPCQPFTKTKNSLRLDQEDKRCKPFRFLMKALLTFEKPPHWILLENVKGFIGSRMYNEWCGTLGAAGYSWKQYVISPKCLGIPNNRTRCYMLCERSDRFTVTSIPSVGSLLTTCPAFNSNQDSTLINDVNNVENANVEIEEGQELQDGEDDEDEVVVTCHEEIADLRERMNLPREILQMNEIRKYLLPDLNSEYLNSFTLTLEELQKPWAAKLSIIGPYDIETYCFTSGYARIHHRASGSYLLMNATSPLAIDKLDRSDMIKYDKQIRKFAPEELLLLFGFPPEYRFPPDINLSQRFRLIGNSISIFVVEIMVRELFLPYGIALLRTPR